MAVDITPSRTGQNNATGDSRALFKEKAMTDILEFFKTTLTISEHITHKSIENGKSASFPVIGTASAQYLAAGDSLNGEAIKHTERIIAIDDLLVAHAFIFDLDAAMEHYNSEAAYMVQIKESLKRSWEQDAYRTLVQAAAIKNATDLAAAGLKAFDEQKYNTPVTVAAADVKKGMVIYQAVLDAYDQWFANENIGEPAVVLQPAQYSALLANPATTGTTFVDDPASQSGKVPLVAGMKVYRTPYLPKAAVTASVSIKAKYAGDYTGTLGVVFSKGAIGVLSLKEIQVELSREHRNKADLMSADMAIGFGILNPACAVLIAVNSSAVLTFF